MTTNQWSSFLAHWAIPLASWVFGTFVGATFRWFYPSRKEWKAERAAKRDKKLDAKVLSSLTDLKMPRSSGGMTGAGMPINRISEIAAYLDENRDDIEESLSRLEMRRSAKSDSGNWFFVPD
jgi:hypothetical protein